VDLKEKYPGVIKEISNEPEQIVATAEKLKAELQNC